MNPEVDQRGEQDILRDGFTKIYIDPHEYAMKTALLLTKNVDKYCKSGTTYVAPYTSLVTSSMMGKTRLMKEIAKYLPIVYMCFRENHETRYPAATSNLLSWFRKGAYSMLGVDPEDCGAGDINTDREYIIPTLRHSLFLLHLLQNLHILIQDLLGPDRSAWKIRL